MITLYFFAILELSYSNGLSFFCDLTRSSNIRSIYSEWNCDSTVEEICSWRGITCNNNVIHEIRLSQLHLEGTIPPSLHLISNLSVLDFSGNNLTSTIPNLIGRLRNLEYLDLSENKLTSTLPSTLFLLPYLTTVSLANNQISGFLFASLTTIESAMSMRYLNLQSNNFSGTISSKWCDIIKDMKLTIYLRENPHLDCYEQDCWDTPLSQHYSSRLVDPSLGICHENTSEVTRRLQSRSQTDSQCGSYNSTLFISVIVLAILLLLSLIANFFMAYKLGIQYWRKQKAASSFPIHALLRRKKRDNIRNSFVLKCIQSNRELAIRRSLSGQTPLDVITYKRYIEDGVVSSEVLYELLRSYLKFDSVSGDLIIDEETKVAWTTAVQYNTDNMVDAVHQILMENKHHAQILAQLSDMFGRRACDIAAPRCKIFIDKYSYLFQRYEVLNTVCMTSMKKVIAAVDNTEMKPIRRLRSNTNLSISPSRINVLAQSFQTKPQRRSFTSGNSNKDCFEEIKIGVMLIFIRSRELFENEIKARGNDEAAQFLIPIHDIYDGDSTDPVDEDFRKDAEIKGFGEYPYCIVVHSAFRTLEEALHSTPEFMSLDDIREITRCLTNCLRHLHEKGLVHGDIRPSKIALEGHIARLIDMDGAADYHRGDLANTGTHTGYACPELLYVSEDGFVRVRGSLDHVKGMWNNGSNSPNWPLTGIYDNTSPNSKLELVRKSKLRENSLHVESDNINSILDNSSTILAHPSQDMWALGCILYQLCTGRSLFDIMLYDNIQYQHDLADLLIWDDALKSNKLQQISDRIARNLISLLLTYDPKQRPSALQVLSHPFLTGKHVSRLQGEAAVWDVFLSYRVASDATHVKMLYEILTKAGLKVWWDKMCLKPGEDWKDGFCEGLINSAHIVFLISRGAINSSVNPAYNFGKLSEHSPCDNFLLEWYLALELKDRKMLQGIFPLVIGDKDPVTGEYSDYRKCGCHPQHVFDRPVKAVQVALHEHLDKEGLGSPLRDHSGVHAILAEILRNQGGSIKGNYEIMMQTVARDIERMSRHVEKMSLKDLVNRFKYVRVRQLEERLCDYNELQKMNLELQQRVDDLESAFGNRASESSCTDAITGSPSSPTKNAVNKNIGNGSELHIQIPRSWAFSRAESFDESKNTQSSNRQALQAQVEALLQEDEND